MKIPKHAAAVAAVLGLVIGVFALTALQRNAHKKGGDTMEHLTMATFKEKICDCGLDGHGEAKWQYKGTVPAIIDFYADWCAPCRMLSPTLEELSKEYGGKVNFYKINTEQQQELAGSFGITGIPSLLFIPVKGNPQMTSGVLPKKELQRIIQENLGVAKPDD